MSRIEAGPHEPRVALPVGAIALVILINLLNHVDRRILSGVFPLIQLEWALTDTQLGMLASIYTIGRTAISLPAALLADRYGRLRVIRAATALWSGLVVLSSLAGSYLQLALLRAGVSLADGANGPADIAYISEQVPGRRQGTGLSIYSLGVYLGSGLGVLVGAVVGESLGWRYAFLIPGVFGMMCAILLYRVRGSLLIDRVDAQDGQRISFDRHTARSLFSPTLLWIYLGSAAGVFASTGVATWMPTYLVRYRQMSLSQAGFFAGGMILVAGTLGLLAGGAASDWLAERSPGARRLAAALALALAVPCGWLGIASYSRELALGAISLAGILFIFPVIPILAEVNLLVRETWRATAMAVLGAVTQVFGAVLAAPLVGLLSDRWGLAAGMALVLVVAFVGALLLFASAARPGAYNLPSREGL